MSRVEGIVSVHPRGFGFIKLGSEEPTQSAFVTPPDLNPFMTGDRVSAELVVQKDGRYSARNLELVEAEQKTVFGTVVRHGKHLFLRIDRQVSNTDWRIVPGAIELAEGVEVVARRESDHVTAERMVTDGDAALARLLVRHNIPSAFRPEAIAQAQTEVDADASTRRDLRDVVTLTVDDDSSMDLDDALSVLPPAPDGALRLMVHIADVDSVVTEGSPLDEDARSRGTSVYLAGHVIPMLPRTLSEDRLSLLPGVDRPALTAELRLDAEGRVTSVDLYPSQIRSDQRLNYEQVGAFLEGQKVDSAVASVADTLRLLRAVGARLAVARSRRGGVRILREEAYITVDDHSKEPTQVHARTSNRAHDLIERLMVAANEAVADWLVERGLPGLFRVHDEPDAARVDALAESARHLGFTPALGTPLTPLALAAFEAQFLGTTHEPVMRTVMHRVLGPAHYTVMPSLHFGLAAPRYVHFTSPIRRYADLAVHRLVRGYLHGNRDRHAGDQALEALAVHLNARSYHAAKAEREQRIALAARLFASKVGDKYAGTIVAIKTFGLVVQMAGTGITGTVAMDDLPGGPFRVDNVRQRLVGSKRTFSIGADLPVEVVGADEVMGRIELRPLKTS